jgi:hypothetical protein
MEKNSILIVLLVALILVTAVLGAVITIGSTQEDQITGSSIDIPDKEIIFEFIDTNTECPLNGEVYFNEFYLGETEYGKIALKEFDYIYNENNFDINYISLKGLTSNCFGDESGLGFSEQWNVGNLEYYYASNTDFILEANIDARRPSGFYSVQSYIRPSEVMTYVDSLSKYFEDHDLEENMDKIMSYSIRYRHDHILFDEIEYWQTPAETLELGHGDCEDWAVTAISMLEAYDPTIDCYLILWQDHVSVLCYVDSEYIIYDQDRTKFSSKIDEDLEELEQKRELRTMREEYFDEFGIGSDARGIYGLVSNDEIVIFNEPEDFIDWLYEFR